jgi:asparagine synthase (glutamine-hydrolysing)
MLKVKVDLKYHYPNGYSWTNDGSHHFIGYAFEKDGLLRNSSKAWNGKLSVQTLINSSGCYAAVLRTDEDLTLVADTAASFPLFWKLEGEELQVSDFIEKEIPRDLSPLVLDSMLKLYCTEFTETFYEGWHCLPAGHYLKIDLQTGAHQLLRWFDHFVVEKQQANFDFKHRYQATLNQIKSQIIEFSKGKQVLLPLSGGYDSRLILSLLAKEPNINLLCYTYGRRDSAEVQNALAIGKQLGLRHEFIPYGEEVFSQITSEDWKHYEHSNFLGRSLPHEQDFFALSILKSRGLLQEGFVALPGYCGDIAGGSFLKNHPIDAEQYIFQKHGYKARHIPNLDGADDWDVYQQWLSENRLSKFIVNSVRVFEHFGGKWMLPLWHPEFLKLFYALRFEDRWGQKAYIDVAFKYFFQPLGIDIRKPISDLPDAHSGWKDRVRQILPKELTKRIRKFTRKSAAADPSNLHVLYEMIYQNMKESGRYSMPEVDYNINFLRAAAHFCADIPQNGKEIDNLEH